MADIKITREKMLTFDDSDRANFFSAAGKLEDFGERQNEANELLAIHITELIRRVCNLEEKQAQTTEILRRIVTEISAAKKELDRLRLSEKLNSGAIDRLDAALRLAQGAVEEEIPEEAQAEELSEYQEETETPADEETEEAPEEVPVNAADDISAKVE